MSGTVSVRAVRKEDSAAIHALYRHVARVPGGLARLEDEVTTAYVDAFLARTLERGIGFVAVAEESVVGEIHAYSPGIFCFSHVLGDLTIAVDPSGQGQGIGRSLFERFMVEVIDGCPEIGRVELIARESNRRAIRFYESMGFVREGVFRQRIRNLDGSIEADVPMAWVRTEPEVGT